MRNINLLIKQSEEKIGDAVGIEDFKFKSDWKEPEPAEQSFNEYDAPPMDEYGDVSQKKLKI